MTIGELEAALDLPRASIRFYEQEGFIHPRRGENNYRDYSEEDAETLRKVKLLRQLGLSLGDIRRAQKGECYLTALLAEQERALARQKADLDWAGQVCRTMREDGVEFATLDAARYLNRLDRPADQPGFFDLRRDAVTTVEHPWRRYFARMLDGGLYSLPWVAVQMLLLRWNTSNDGFLLGLLNSYIGYGCMLLLEPLLLSTWGTTPGKWIFGLVLRSPEGKKLTFSQALGRTWQMFCRGMGGGIPIYNIYRLIRSWLSCRRGEQLPWDEGVRYTLRDTKKRRIAGWLGAAGAYFMLVLALTAFAFLPPHRGPLTAAEYVDNVNDICAFQELAPHVVMDSSGHWVDRPGDQIGVPNPQNRYATHQLIVDEEGIVTGVRIETERPDSPGGLVQLEILQPQLAVLAMTGGWGLFSGDREILLDAVQQRPLDSFMIRAGDMTLTQQVEYQGIPASRGWLFSEDGEEARYHLVFTLEKTA